MAKRQFHISLNGEAVIELDDAVITAVTDKWRGKFYNLHSSEDIAVHIGYNIFINGATLSLLDGFGDQPNSNVRVVEQIDWSVEAKGVKE